MPIFVWVPIFTKACQDGNGCLYSWGAYIDRVPIISILCMPLLFSKGLRHNYKVTVLSLTQL